VGWFAARQRRHGGGGFVVVAALCAALAGCTAAPPPPLVAPPVARTSIPPSPDTSQVVVGVDGITGGYNPHELADQSSVTTALSTLLLPSVFRNAADGTPQLDTTLMVSAQVTAARPFTVTYQLRTDASWSDGTPIDAADFAYLRNQMSTQPGVLNPAGYRLISGITARDNAKTITVTFTKAYPAWRTLFNDLLPAHLLKDAPGGFANGLNTSFPATAGPFDIKTVDAAGGEIVLERSDRYWGTPSVLDQIVLRKSDNRSMVDGLRSSADQVVYSRVDSTGAHAFAELGSTITRATVPRPEIAAVLLRPGSAQLADQTVRVAVAAAVNRSALITTGTAGGPSAHLVANALVTAPSQSGYRATIPAKAPGRTPDPARVPALLAQAGYVQSGSTWTRDGRDLNVVIAAPAGEQPFVAIATQLRAQLVGAGIPATLETPQPGQLYEQLLGGRQTGSTATANGTNAPIDILVGPQPAGGDPATELASWFGCASAPAAGGPTPPAGPFGWCDQAIQPAIDSALTGETPSVTALADAESALWAQAVEIPLFQLSDELAVGQQVDGVAAGPPMAGPFFGAATWSRVTER
jgi:ABC-type transport system substrate-binding protein